MSPDPLATAARLLLANVPLDDELASAAGAYLSRWGAMNRARRRQVEPEQQRLRFPVYDANDASVAI
jgi:hypothetical protein